MTLPEADTVYLENRRIVHETTVEGGATNVVFRSWPLPVGFDRSSSDLLLRLQAGYPDIPPDMRWSRHLQPNQWESGIDGLECCRLAGEEGFEPSIP